MPERVTDYMTSKVVSVGPDAGIREAFFKMKEHHIRHLPVVEGNKLLGIVSDRELRRPDWVDETVDVSHVYHLDDALSVSDVMIKKVHVVHTYDSLRKAVRLLLDNRIGAAPVLDKTGALVGMLSAVDLLGALYKMEGSDKNAGQARNK
jgi:acetoin utilization protein AcuB